MNTKLLIDLIVRQTTVLIAQLSTAAGIRAPLADIADQLFVQLSQALEAQGVPRKVVADMFGLALRGYQKKVQRLTESATEQNKTLWQAVLDHLHEQGTTSRHKLFARFNDDDTASLGAVLTDLVNSGLVFKTGAGEAALYGVTRESDYRALVQEQDLESTASLVWVTVYRSSSISRAKIMETLKVDEERLDRALTTLCEQGRIERQGDVYSTATLMIPVGSGQGWESAVFDHFQAMVTAIGSKLSMGKTRSDQADVVGGSTLSFDVHEGHPHRDEVLALLGQVRGQVNELWKKVVAYDNEHPVPEAQKQRVSFYFGQSVQQPGES
jgi:hypothetical protein